MIHRVVGIAAGVLLLAAAVLKLSSPDAFMGAVMHVVQPLMAPDTRGAQFMGTAVVTIEAALGVLLILGTGRLRYAAASAVFVAFAIVLAARFLGPGAPPCACLGRLLSPTNQAVWIDIVRNVSLAVALCVAMPPKKSNPSRVHHSNVGQPLAEKGFTIVELLVTIGIIAILVATALPAIAGAKRAAKQTESLNTSRNAGLLLRAYATDNREFFPAFTNLGSGTAGPVSVRGQALWVGYFRAHMTLWPAAVLTGEPGAMPSIRHPMLRDQPFDPDQTENYETLFFLTASVAADPALFQITTVLPYNPSMIGPRKWTDVQHPSSKGLLLDMYWWGRPRFTNLAAFCDGSAAQFEGVPNTELAPVPGDGPIAPVLSTLHGLHGRDR